MVCAIPAAIEVHTCTYYIPTTTDPSVLQRIVLYFLFI